MLFGQFLQRRFNDLDLDRFSLKRKWKQELQHPGGILMFERTVNALDFARRN